MPESLTEGLQSRRQPPKVEVEGLFIFGEAQIRRALVLSSGLGLGLRG